MAKKKARKKSSPSSHHRQPPSPQKVTLGLPSHTSHPPAAHSTTMDNPPAQSALTDPPPLSILGRVLLLQLMFSPPAPCSLWLILLMRRIPMIPLVQPELGCCAGCSAEAISPRLSPQSSRAACQAVHRAAC
ncbi:hypothetical protein OIU85_017837 [Salix viminalis]|uniref:Uncharacterized protein n=1 Tax=Salix viminalis TaxID=40686 RepID=A0A9Q0NI33_SALVM|nr:hypothetical protein OIU85_017837 [Salix viminalis]